MDKIYKTPCFEKGLIKSSCFRRLFKTEKPPAAAETGLARQTLRQVHNAFSENLQDHHLDFESGKITAIPGILEEVSRNICKIDQNLYSIKGDLEELLRVNNRINHAASRETVALD